MTLDRRLRQSIALAWLAATLAGCGQEPVISGPATPPMWEAERGSARIIMIGSVHQLPPSLDWRDPRVSRAVAEAGELWLELAPEDLASVPALFDRLSGDEPVAPLAQRIGVARARQVDDLANASGADDADRMESWALALIVGAQSANDSGLSREHGVEAVLTRQFRQAQKPVRGLERPIDQLGAFDSLSPDAQDRMLAIAADGAADSRSRIRRLLSAWAAGDIETLAQIAQADVARVPGLSDRLVIARNQAWLAQIDGDGTATRTVLIAVGSGHLVGDSSLPSLLQARGFTVRRLLPMSER